MNYIEWLRQVDQNQLDGVTLVLVEEPYLWDKARTTLKDDVVGASFLDFNYEEGRFLQIDRVALETALETMPLMQEKRVVVFDEMPLGRDQLKNAEQSLAQLQDYIETPNPTTLLYLVYRGAKPFQGKFVKALLKKANTLEIGRLNPRELASFIQKKLQQAKIEAGGSVVDFVAQQTGYLDRDSAKTLYDVENEVEKIISGTKGKRLTTEMVEELLVANLEDNVFRMLDALSQKNLKLAMLLYQGFRKQDQDAYMLFYMIVRQIRNLITVKELAARRYSDAEGMGKAKLSKFEYGKLKQSVRNFDLDELLDLHDAAWRVEVDMKTKPVDMDLCMQLLIARFCRQGVRH